jgi:hypothetical protein
MKIQSVDAHSSEGRVQRFTDAMIAPGGVLRLHWSNQDEDLTLYGALTQPPHEDHKEKDSKTNDKQHIALHVVHGDAAPRRLIALLWVRRWDVRDSSMMQARSGVL